MKRCNLFEQAHKGLRALLYDTGTSLQHTEFWNIEEASQIILRLREVICLFGKHAYGEDCFVLTAVKKYEPSIGDVFEQDHAKGRELAEDLAAALNAYEITPLITGKVWIAEKIHQGYLRFLAFHIDLMTKQEDVLNPILWRYYEDADLKCMAKKILANMPAALHVKMNGWMLRGMKVGEIIGWLKEVEKNNGGLIYEALLNSVEIALPWQRFDLVIKGLDETMAAA